MPYKYSKCGTTAQPLPLVFNTVPVDLPYPHVTEIRHVVENIEHLSGLRRDGRLDLASADSLISDQRLIRDALIEEARLVLAQGGEPNQTIRIEGGLPPLPLGPKDQPVIMPALNGSTAALAGYEPLSSPNGPTLPVIPVKGDGET
jgi:hypothetical protein